MRRSQISLRSSRPSQHFSSGSKPARQTFWRQAGYLFCLLLKLKAYRFFILPVVILTLLSNLYLSRLYIDSNHTVESDGPTFYSTSIFASAGHKALIDRSAHAATVKAFESLLSNRSGGRRVPSVLQDCRLSDECHRTFAFEPNDSPSAEIFYIRGEPTLICHRLPGSSLCCAFLYQLLSQAMAAELSNNGVFKEVQLFTLRVAFPNSSTDRRPGSNGYEALPNCLCSDWVRAGSYVKNINSVMLLSLPCITISVAAYFLLSTVSCIRTLKTNGFLRHLFRSGLPVRAYWMALWSITMLECLLFASIFILSHVLHCFQFYQAGIAASVFALFYFFCLSLAGLQFLLELLLPSFAAMVTGLVLSCFAIVISLILHSHMSPSAIAILLLFLPLNACGYIVKLLQSGFHENSSTDPTSDLPVYFMAVLISVSLTPVALAAVTGYLDFVLRSGNGLLLPYNYPLVPRFWWPRQQSQGTPIKAEEFGKNTKPYMEPVQSLWPSVVVRDVTATSRRVSPCCNTGKLILSHLSCECYKDHITAVVSQSKAEISTLMHIILGEQSPAQGKISIHNFLVTDAIQRLSLRGRIGYCPDVDALCSALTVMECIEAVLVSRGMKLASREKRICNLLHRLDLFEMKNCLSKNLSISQKRKLSTVLAFVGRTEVILLHEPTAGLGPTSKQQVWKFLHEVKLGRTIIVFTQVMEEADAMADRKILLIGGEIACSGSSQFLRRSFNCSFLFTVSFKTRSEAKSIKAKLTEARVKTRFQSSVLLEVSAVDLEALDAAVLIVLSSEQIDAFGLSQISLGEMYEKFCGIASARDIREAFRTDRMAALLDKMEAKNVKIESLGSSISEENEILRTRRPSVCHLLRTLLMTHLRSQYRTPFVVWCRFIITISMLALIGLVVLFYHPEIKVSRSPSLKREDVRSSKSLIDAAAFRTVCLYDSEITLPVGESDCARLSLSKDDASSLPATVIKKPRSVSLQTYINQRGVIKELLSEVCRSIDCRVILFYASPWSPEDHNSRRLVSVGIIYTAGVEDPKGAWLHVFTSALKTLLEYFKAGSQPKLSVSQILSFSRYASYRFELLLVLSLFCMFPITFLQDLEVFAFKGFSSHLASMGVSGFTNFISLFVLHWIQYSVCFLASVSLLCITDLYRNQLFFMVAILPTLFLGTISNQLAVYVLAIVLKAPSTFACLELYCIAACLPHIFYFLALTTSNLLVLPMICLLPPVAPIALLYYSTRMSSYGLILHLELNVNEIAHLRKISWKDMHILMSLITMAVHVVLLSIALVVIIYRNVCVQCASMCNDRSSAADSKASSDHGAQLEVARLTNEAQNPSSIAEVRRVRKTYANDSIALDDVTFAARASELLGLVGSDGAGKSTTLAVLAGIESATSGDCEMRSVDENWLSCKQGARRGAVGYCPQRSRFLSRITVWEHLLFYAELRGLDSVQAKQQAKRLLKNMKLEEMHDKYTRALSYSHMRRLSLAIALLGNPSLVLVDEAAANVDLASRQCIWRALRSAVTDSRAVVVATTSMDEAESLQCGHIGILNNGRMVAFGGLQQLISRHTEDGYSLDVLLKPGEEARLNRDKSEIGRAVTEKFDGAVILDQLGASVNFLLPIKSVKELSTTIKWLLENSRLLRIKYCSLYQMSLDQLFLKLAKQYEKCSSETS